MKIAIVGAGAIGLYYGAKIASGGGDVHFLLRSDFEVIRRNGIQINGTDVLQLQHVNAYRAPDEIGECDVVIVALKTTANAALADLLPPLIGANTAVVTLQNGLGNEEFIASLVGEARVLGGLCFVCLIRIAPGLVEHYDVGHLRFGEFQRPASARVRAVADEFSRGGVSCSVTDDLATERWRKLVWNIPFNGLSIVAGSIDTQAILRDAALRKRARALMLEVIAAANACRHPLSVDNADEQLRRTETLGAYKPSTLLDYEAGRPIELEAIWGEPLRRAEAAGVATPLLRELYEELRA